MIDISKNNEGDIALNYLIKVSPEFINISKETGTLKLEPIKDRTIFVSLVRAVINQQISGKASEKIYSNLIQNIGNGKYIKPTAENPPRESVRPPADAPTTPPS